MLRQPQVVAEQVYAIIVEVSQQANIAFDQDLDLSSIQVLKALALVEKTFQIEVEDEEVFHGIFKSVQRLNTYVQAKLVDA